MSRFTHGKVTVTRKAQAPNPAADAARVVVVLKKRDRAFVIRWITLAILGFFVLWVGPVIVGTIVFLARMRESYTPWVTCFLWTSLIVIPILFFFEYLSRGKFFEGTVEGLGGVADYGYYANVTTFHARGRLAAGALAIEICLWGPRMVIAGFRRIAALSSVKPADHAPPPRSLLSSCGRTRPANGSGHDHGPTPAGRILARPVVPRLSHRRTDRAFGCCPTPASRSPPPPRRLSWCPPGAGES